MSVPITIALELLALVIAVFAWPWRREQPPRHAVSRLMTHAAARIAPCTVRGNSSPRTSTSRGTWIVAIVAYLVRGRRGLTWAQRALGGSR